MDNDQLKTCRDMTLYLLHPDIKQDRHPGESRGPVSLKTVGSQLSRLCHYSKKAGHSRESGNPGCKPSVERSRFPIERSCEQFDIGAIIQEKFHESRKHKQI